MNDQLKALEGAMTEVYRHTVRNCDLGFNGRGLTTEVVRATDYDALRAELAKISSENESLLVSGTKAAEELARVRENRTKAEIWSDWRCKKDGVHLAHDMDADRVEKIAGLLDEVRHLQEELARERERHQGLENVARAFLAVTALSEGSLTTKIRRRAETLLAPAQPADTKNGEGN